jgi:RDD family
LAFRAAAFANPCNPSFTPSKPQCRSNAPGRCGVWRALRTKPYCWYQSFSSRRICSSRSRKALQGPLKRPLFQLWLVGVLAAYFSYCWTHGGQTLAMKTWRIRLVTSDGAPIALRQAIARFLIALCGVLLLGAGFWWAFFDRDRQFLHDRLCNTRLVEHGIAARPPSG